MSCSTYLSFRNRLVRLFIFAPVLVCSTSLIRAQTYERELSTSAKTLLTIKNRTGRVSVIASNNEKDKPSLKATSTGAPVEPGDISVSNSEIVVRERPYRIDITVRVPKRARVRVESEAGMVDVIGDFDIADVITNTGTIHADVPLDALKFKFQWQSSRPRFLSDVELPRVKEGRAGAFSIAGIVGPDAERSKHKKQPPQSENTDNENQTVKDEQIEKTVETNSDPTAQTTKKSRAPELV